MDILELFAGVGGFRVGLERVNKNHQDEEPFFNVVWSNQFEPSTKIQHASRVYCRAFGEINHVNRDIATVDSSEISVCDMLVGGFPCQDYSVARVSSQAVGIEGKKGVLWWEIIRIVRDKGENAPQILFLENVDRLLKSPSKQRGRDFAIILSSLNDLGYVVEWRVINAADYGMPQRRRRTWMLAYKKNSVMANQIGNPMEWILREGVFAKSFPVYNDESMPLSPIALKEDPNWDMADLFAEFNKGSKDSPFQNSGLMVDGVFYTYNTVPMFDGKHVMLGDILVNGEDCKFITEDFYVQEKDISKWEHLKGAWRELRKTKDGFEYWYNQGAMAFPDFLDKPSRTIITSEGGAAPSRFKHVVKDPINGRLRRLIPLELERLNMFDDNHTIGESDTKRAFLIGNALVCGIVTRVGEEIRRRYVS